MLKKFKAMVVHRESGNIRVYSGQAQSWNIFVHLCRRRLIDSLQLPYGEMISTSVTNITGIKSQQLKEENI